MSKFIGQQLSSDTYYVPIYDLFLDLPHPEHSTHSESARIIGPHPWNPDTNSPLQQELFEPDIISKISKYAFPDHNDQLVSASMSYKSILKGLSDPERDCLNRHDIYFYNFPQAHYHTFLLRLTCGIRIHGHVRRYLPPHPVAYSRTNVGRRGIRAMVILTRSSGGDQFWTSVLRTLESVALLSSDGIPASKIQQFLFSLHENHRLLYSQHEAEEELHGDSYDSKSQQNSISFVQVAGIEFGKKDGIPRVPSDVVSFLLPLSLQPGYRETAVEDIDAPLLPLLRCLKATNYMRLMSALLCERRVILISDNVSRLSACVQGASALLAQGLLVWQHVFIPVLPPHLLKYLATPMPYLIGLLEPYARDLDIIPGVGGVLCINLDSNTLWTFNVVDPSLTFPDLMSEIIAKKGGWIDQVKSDSSQESLAVINTLSSNLKSILKSDRKTTPRMRVPAFPEVELTLPPNSDVKPLSRPAKKGGWQMFKYNPRKSSMQGVKLTEADDGDSSEDEHDNEDNSRKSSSRPLCSTLWNSFDNEGAEESIRIALVSFFLYLYGDLGMYLTEDENGILYLDRKKFLLLKKIGGDTENSAIFRVVANLSRSSKFKQFVKARIKELEDEENEIEIKSTKFTPLFAKCQKYLLLDRVQTESVPDLVKKLAESCPQRRLVAFSEVVRERAQAMSSKIQEFDDMAVHEMVGLGQESRDVVLTLRCVMGVIWMRMLSTKTSKLSTLFALHMLRLLLLHGPISAISEVIEISMFVRPLLMYGSTNKEDESQQEIREAASCVLELLSDIPKLSIQRKQCICQKMIKSHLRKAPMWNDYVAGKIPYSAPFSLIHRLFRPSDEKMLAKKTTPHYAILQSFAEYSMNDDESMSKNSLAASAVSDSSSVSLSAFSVTPSTSPLPVQENKNKTVGSSESERQDDSDDDVTNDEVYSVGWSKQSRSVSVHTSHHKKILSTKPYIAETYFEGDGSQDPVVNTTLNAANGSTKQGESNDDDTNIDVHSVGGWSLAADYRVVKQENQRKSEPYMHSFSKALSSKSDFSDNGESNVPPSNAFQPILFSES